MMGSGYARGELIFPFGGQYAPAAKSRTVDKSEWDNDIHQIKDLGMNAFRIFIAWDRIERKEGVRDFGDVDHILDCARKHRMKVLVNIGGVFANLQGIYPPKWLLRDYHCQQPVHAASDKSPDATPWQICQHDPVFKEKALDFLIAAVQHIASREELFAWMIWNEPSVEPCCCPHTIALYQKWLKEKYHSVEAVNDAWGDEFPVCYRAWDEIQPQAGVGFYHGGYTPWLDWNEFLRHDLSESIMTVRDVVKKHDIHNRPVTLNIIHDDVLSRGVRRRINPWDIGEILDVPGLSAYTFHFPQAGGHASNCAAIFDRIRSTSTAPGKPWYCIESQAGPVYWVHGLPPLYTRTEDRVLQYWQIVAHGAKCIFNWNIRSRVANAQAGEFGLLAWDGSVTERAIATGELASILNEHADTILSRHPKSDVAILVSESARDLYATETSEQRTRSHFGDYWDRSWMGAYRMLWSSHITADFIDERHVSRELAERYKAILIPFHPSLNERLARGLAEYAAAGGTIIADAFFGFKSDEGLLLQRAPGFGLHDIFGGYINDALPVSNGEDSISLADGSLEPVLFRQEIITGNGETIAKWKNGSTAIAGKRIGNGRTILAGTMLFMYGYDPNAAADEKRRSLVLSWLAEAGVVAPVALAPISGRSEALANVEVRTLVSEDTGALPLYIVLNHNAIAADCIMTMSSGADRYRELISGKELSVGPGPSVHITMGAKSVLLILSEHSVSGKEYH